MPAFRLTRARLLAIGALALLLLAAGPASRALLGERVPALRVVRGPLVQRVIANGRVWVPARLLLGVNAAGTVARLAVDEGARVAAGDTLLALANAEQRAALAEAEARLRRARELDRPDAAEALAQAETDLSRTERRLRRLEELAAGGAAAPEDLDEARDDRDLARSRRDAAAARARAFAPGGAEEAVAEAAVATARARLGHTVLVALAPGTVLERRVAAGDVVQGGQTLLVMARADSTWLTVQPEERSLAWLSVGQEAVASTDAFPRETFRAVVARLAPAIDEKRGTVEVRLLVPEPPAYLRPDMTVSIDVAAARRDDALLAPAEAVRDAESPAPWALVLRGGRARRAELRLGLRGQGVVEVLDGLAAGEHVVPATAGSVRPGQRARPAPLAAGE